MVPDDVRDGVKKMLEGLREGLSYDQVRDRAYDQIDAVEDWIARVDRSTR